MILVTGATGLVGSYLLLELSKRGEEVFAMKRSTSSVEATKKLFKDFSDIETFEKIHWIEADLLDIPSLIDALKGIKTIYHTAAVVGFDKKISKTIKEINVIGTENLVNIAISEKVENLIFFSSISTLDTLLHETEIHEKSKWNPELSYSEYAISKYKSEMQAWRGSQEGLNVLVLYPSIIIGSFDGKRESEMIFRLASKKTAWATEGVTAYVDVRDVAYCAVELAEKGVWEEGYILCSEHRSYIEIFNYLRKKWGMSQARVINKKQLNLFRKLSNITQYFGTPYLSKSNYIALTNRSTYRNDKVKKALDFEFIGVEEALDFHSERYQSIVNKKNRNGKFQVKTSSE